MHVSIEAGIYCRGQGVHMSIEAGILGECIHLR